MSFLENSSNKQAQKMVISITIKYQVSGLDTGGSLKEIQTFVIIGVCFGRSEVWNKRQKRILYPQETCWLPSSFCVATQTHGCGEVDRLNSWLFSTMEYFLCCGWFDFLVLSVTNAGCFCKANIHFICIIILTKLSIGFSLLWSFPLQIIHPTQPRF